MTDSPPTPSASAWALLRLQPLLRRFLPELRQVDFGGLVENSLFRTLVGQVALGLLTTLIGVVGTLFIVINQRWPIVPGLAASSWKISLAVVGIGLVLLAGARANLKSALSRVSGSLPSVALDQPDDRDLKRFQQQRERAQEARFQRNLKDTFILQSFELRQVRFFDDCLYRLQPRVNVLLGKNGYGKTFLLRALAAVIQAEEQFAGQLFPPPSDTKPDSRDSGGRLKLEVTRNGTTEEVIRDSLAFSGSTGRIPLLAIPDSRFVNRAQVTVGPSATGHEPLSRSGAHHFLTQESYQDVVQELLAQLGIDYVEGGSLVGPKGFKRPLFRLIEEVVRDLTGDEEFAFDEIRRSGRTGFQILVRTTGSQGEAIPIQYASQGTLSIVAIFGLTYSFLRALDPQVREDKVLGSPGIVLIDEIDAHLHPSWHQKIVRMLCDRFPNVQFIVSAHSPAIVAGCDWGEAAVLRRNSASRRFYVERLERDFIGATAREMYDQIFEIDDIDQTYLEYATKSTRASEEERDREIQRLEDKRQRTDEEDRRLDQVVRESRLIARAAEVRKTRLEDERTRIEDLEARIRELEQRAGNGEGR